MVRITKKDPLLHRGGVNNGKNVLIRTAVKHRRGANNEIIILIRTAAVANSLFLFPNP